MTFRNGHWPGYLCAPPPGFRQLLCKKSLPPSHFSKDSQHKISNISEHSPISLIFSNTPELPTHHQFTRKNSLNIHCFPKSLTLLTLDAHTHPSPLEYLNEMNVQLKKTLPRYQQQFTKTENWGNIPLVISQSRFETNFFIYRLSCSWVDQKNLFITELNTADMHCKNEWKLLKKFIHSFKIL